MGGSIMYIYKIESSAVCDSEDEVFFDIDYMTHEKKFTQEEFDMMCKDVINNETEIYNYTLKKRLKDLGFEYLNPVASFSYEETV